MVALPFLFKGELKEWNLPTRWSFLLKWLSIVGVGLLMGMFLYEGGNVLQSYSLKEHFDLMLHVFETQAIRFLDGVDPYLAMSDIWSGRNIIYQVGMWLPLLPAIAGGFDLRWMSLLLLIAGLGWVYRGVLGKRNLLNLVGLLSLLPLGYLFVYLLTQNTWPLKVSLEGIVVFWYLILGIGIIQKNPYLQGFALIMCLLSRPAIVFWVPAWYVLLYFGRSRKEALTVLWVSLVGLVAFFILPFRWTNLDYFLQLPQTYLSFAEESWLKHADSYAPFLGLASRFAPDRLAGLMRWQWLSLLLSPALLLVLRASLQRKGKHYSTTLWGLAGIKLCLLLYTQLHPLSSVYLSLSNTCFSFLLFFYVVKSAMDRSPQPLSSTKDIIPASPKASLSPALLAGGLLLFVLLEVLSNTRFVRPPFQGNFDWSSVVYIISGLMIAVIPLFRVPDKPLPALLPDPQSRAVSIIKWLCIVVIGFTLFQKGAYLISETEIDYTKADMLPAMKMQAERFLNGEDVYAKLVGIWRGTFRPIYMTGFWGAFVPFVKLGLDIRWATIGGLLLSLGLIMSLIPAFKSNQSLFVLLSLLPLFFLFESLWEEQEPIIRLTEEGIVMFYYTFLGFALFKKNPYLIGIALALCLLSRYSLLPWLPFYALYAFFFEKRRDVYITAGIATFLVLFGFLIPYGFENWDFFFKHPSRYQGFAERSWERNTAFFGNSLGMAKFFTQETVRYQYKLHMFLAFAAPATMIGIWWWLKRKGSRLLSARFLGLCSLKITLVFFYNMIVLPVFYLFFVNTIFSLVILFAYIGAFTKYPQSEAS